MRLVTAIAAGAAEALLSDADAKPSAAAHDKAATANRIASTMHKTAAQLIPERAEHHEAAARAHARAAEHHEAEMHKHEPHAANATLKLSVDVVCLGALTDADRRFLESRLLDRRLAVEEQRSRAARPLTAAVRRARRCGAEGGQRAA
mgnify:CR=1 FL=1